MRIASYNIRKAVETDRKRDPGRILCILTELLLITFCILRAASLLSHRPALSRDNQSFGEVSHVIMDEMQNRTDQFDHRQASLR